ncbi:hypothetical protein AVEN_126747-1 [Araneus ventricosus]|uniref:Uncharacterized protein n=1 Tax=Araneus ventricosus TaxID=182803 RepID=A0A4Y2UJH6_ARAVE|nr:hypothetical protein AVEN_126747-1 [Araneus ventricosus]
MPGEGKPTFCGIVHQISFFSARAVVMFSKIEGKGPHPVTNISSSLFHPTGLFETLGSISCVRWPDSPLSQLSCQMQKQLTLSYISGRKVTCIIKGTERRPMPPCLSTLRQPNRLSGHGTMKETEYAF